MIENDWIKTHEAMVATLHDREEIIDKLMSDNYNKDLEITDLTDQVDCLRRENIVAMRQLIELRKKYLADCR